MRNALQRLAFIDESEPLKAPLVRAQWRTVKTNMVKTTGWAPLGQRLRDHAPFGHWRTQTFVAALRHDRLDAPWVIDGAMNRDMFERYVETQLAPSLRPGDVIRLGFDPPDQFLLLLIPQQPVQPKEPAGGGSAEERRRVVHSRAKASTGRFLSPSNSSRPTAPI